MLVADLGRMNFFPEMFQEPIKKKTLDGEEVLPGELWQDEPLVPVRRQGPSNTGRRISHALSDCEALDSEMGCQFQACEMSVSSTNPNIPTPILSTRKRTLKGLEVA